MRSQLSWVLLSMLLVATGRAQELEGVRQAVNRCVGDSAQAAVAREQLTDWGNKALPYLRELAGKPEEATAFARVSPFDDGDRRLVSAVQLVDTPEAVNFLVEMLDRKTRVTPYHVLTMLDSSISAHGPQMRSDVRLKQLVFKFAKDETDPLSDLARMKAADLMAALDWDD